MYDTSDFRNGLKIEYQGDPFIIVEFQHVKPGKGNQFTRTKIKNLITGRVLDPTFKSGEKVGKPDIEEKDMQYLYKEGEHYACMDMVTYDQVVVDKDAVADQAKWLKENDNVSVLFLERDAPLPLKLKSTLSSTSLSASLVSKVTRLKVQRSQQRLRPVRSSMFHSL